MRIAAGALRPLEGARDVAGELIVVGEPSPQRRIVGVAREHVGGAGVRAAAARDVDGGVRRLADLVVQEAQLAAFGLDDDLAHDELVDGGVDGVAVGLGDGGDELGRPGAAEHGARFDEAARFVVEPVEAAGDERLHRAGRHRRR